MGKIIYLRLFGRGRVDSPAREPSLAESDPFPRSRCQMDSRQYAPVSKSNKYSLDIPSWLYFVTPEMINKIKFKKKAEVYRYKLHQL